MRSKNGFTLVELLVVISIIVVLLAMLLPAMEGAAYQAQLARCMSQLDGIATGAITYATNQKTFFPVPPGGRHGQPDQLTGGGMNPDPQQDLRPVLSTYISLAILQCPLTGIIDLSPAGNKPESIVFSPYALPFGWEHTDGNTEGGLMRIGDRLGWTNVADDETHYFRVIASDLNDFLPSDKYVQTSHPDPNGRMSNAVFQNFQREDDLTVTSSRWQLKRNKIDLNFAFTDGSVELFREAGRTDPRFRYVPVHATGETMWRFYMPPN